ncbi:MAG: hypothetical protein M3N54_16310 [Acidobacteriota bacterium]|nr:hypothetical protein [Acidobacteriota bacterium]
MKQDSEYFEGRDSELIYIARRLSDATRLESILADAGIDFGVEADEYQGGVVFRRTRIGAFFYVLPEVRDQAITAMQAGGYIPLAVK